jgi:hypothetical protein
LEDSELNAGLKAKDHLEGLLANSEKDNKNFELTVARLSDFDGAEILRDYLKAELEKINTFFKTKLEELQKLYNNFFQVMGNSTVHTIEIVIIF